MPKNLKQWIRIAGTVVLAYIISHFIIYDISTISYFKPMEKSRELAITDFYQIVANNKNIKALEQNIVIVSIDSCGRREIAQLLETIDFCNPAAVGLDVFFNYPSADDSLLISAIEGCNNLVLPCSAVYDNQSGSCTGYTGSFFYNSLSTKKSYGSVNLAGNDMQSLIREFRPFHLCNGDTINSFATALVKIASPDSYRMLKERGNTMETINFPAYEFDVYTPQEVLEFSEELEGKIVLIGSLEEPWDFHVTPVSSQMPGIMIHAHSIATILNNRYIKELDGWVIWLIAIVLSAAMLIIKEKLDNIKFESLIMRGIQMLMLYLIIVTGYSFYNSRHLSIDFAIPLMMVGLIFTARDIWNGSESLIQTIKEKIEKRKNRQ